MSRESPGSPSSHEDMVLTRTCLVCDESKLLTRFPTISHVPSHNHNNDVCNECYASHLEVQVDTKMWDQIACPQCPATLQRDEISVLASPETWVRYQYLAERATQSNDPKYRRCFSATCDSGHVHDGGLVFACQACGHKHCTACEVNWHEGETCEQYQARHQAQQQQEAASEEMIQIITKPCPQCHTNIEKSNGCDHMSCSRCNHQFCWPCLADWTPITRHGPQFHETNCPNYRPEPNDDRNHILQALFGLRLRGMPVAQEEQRLLQFLGQARRDMQ